uniref:Transcriptional-regulating factor 1 n=2 Tax=Cacopsylla melanoneura TaxID=428564 RepID=A0A8D8YZU9_9HEMI
MTTAVKSVTAETYRTGVMLLGLHEVPGNRLPSYATSTGTGSQHTTAAVFMYSTSAEGGVTLQLRDADDFAAAAGADGDKSGGLASVLARLQEDAGVSISYQTDGELGLSGTEEGLDHFLLGSAGAGTCLTTKGNAVGSSEDIKGTPDSSKLSVKKPRPKPTSPNRQGPQQCQVCGKVFGNASALAKHKLTHSDERKYVCTMCGKAFKRQDHLNGHMLTHRNKKPYECKAEGCGKSYCDARSLRRHTENHHSSSLSSSSPTSSSSSTSSLCSSSASSTTSLASNGTVTSTAPSSGDGGGGGSPSPSCIQYAPAPTPPLSSPSRTSVATSSTSSPSTAITGAAASQSASLLAIKCSLVSASATHVPSVTSSVSPSGTPSSSQLQSLLMETTSCSTSSSVASSTTTACSSSSISSSKARKKQRESISTSTHNDVLSQHQLDLIQQIMQQTAKAVVSSPASQGSQSPSSSSAKTKTWTVQNGHQVTKAVSSTSSSSSVKSSIRTAAGPQQASAAAVAATVNNINALLSSTVGQEQKPVECNLCHRKFKNIPALNGHMRLHGGYFKKDSESKKHEKKDSSTSGVVVQPLQTASISVRALIEEKIIQKRSSNPGLAAHTQTNLSYSTNSAIQNVQTTPSVQFSDSGSAVSLSVSENSSDSLKLSSFIVPATPNINPDDKHQNLLRRHSASEHFISPRTPPVSTSPSNEAQILSDILLKKNPNKPAVKRASSDPGRHTNQTTEVNMSFNDTLTSYTGVLGVYQGDDGYFSPSLQDEMFNHVQAIQDSLLLQGVDAAQLAESIQAATLQEIASLEEYSNSDPNGQYQQDLQSVLNSPLPVSIADFAYQAQANQSFQQETTFTQSPLPSPSFTYPTPPASQEGQSPSFGNLQSVISHPSSSPLSASFCMSSSAAVEAALNEVLPMEQHNIYPSPPPQSPLSGTPVPSPMSLPSSAVSSPLPHQMLQSQMMSNSDDPLLSSSPKDFASRKKFDFHTFKILNNGSLDYLNGNQQGVTGIVLDRNGELKLIQNGFQNGKPNGVLNGNITTVYVKQEPQCMETTEVKPVANKTYHSPSRNTNTTPQIKEEIEDEAFVNPISMADNAMFKYSTTVGNGHSTVSNSNSSSFTNSRKRRFESSSSGLTGSFGSHCSYQSRLRSVRSRTSSSAPPLHYTPSPVLSPSRSGSGLYWQAVTSWPSSTTFKDESVSAAETRYLESRDVAPESDTTPHVNIGPQYQALIPECCPYGAKTEREPTYEHLLWDPGISKVTSDSEVDMYLEFACCAAVPGGGRNKEYALHLLHLCNGNIHTAMLRLMQPTPMLPFGHPLLSMEYTDNQRWNITEIEIFQQALLKYDKDLSSVAQEIGSKTLKQCIQFYYLWKKVCPEEYKRIRLSRRRNRDFDFDFEFKSDIPVNDVDMVSTSSESRLFVCEYPDCSASFNSRAALNGHIKIHGGASTVNSSGERRQTPTPTHLSVSSADLLEEFPCKICGKVFSKVKSRSAHMKSHRPLDSEPKHNKNSLKTTSSEPLSVRPLDNGDPTISRAMGTSSTCVQSHLRPN